MGKAEIRGPSTTNIEPALPSLRTLLSDIAGTSVELSAGSWSAISIDCTPTGRSKEAITIVAGADETKTQLHIGLQSDDMAPHEDRAWLLVTETTSAQPDGPTAIVFLGRGAQPDISAYAWRKVADIHTAPGQTIKVNTRLPNDETQLFELANGARGKLIVLTGQNHWDVQSVGLGELNDEMMVD